MKRQIRAEVTLTPPPSSLSHGGSLLHLPPDLLDEILIRLPVKSLLQLQCFCRQLNSLISNTEFHQKYLRFSFSTNRFQLHTITPLGYRHGITSYPLHSILSSIDLSNATTDFECPLFNQDKRLLPRIVGSCDGILCFADCVTDLIVMCNPSIRKFNQLPLPLEEENTGVFCNKGYGFGYDPLSHHYKVVVVKGKNQVKIHTLGTYSWRSIGDFPFDFFDRVGVSLSGTVNWLAYNDMHKTNVDSTCVIVSLNLENESFQEVPQPNYGRKILPRNLSLSVQRDCLCLVADQDVWIMKEFGNQNSWTKLITIPYREHPSTSLGFSKLLHISEDDKFVVKPLWLSGRLFVYDSRNSIFKYHPLINLTYLSIESLISP